MIKPIKISRTFYPRLPDIIDQDTLSTIAILETKERVFIMQTPNKRQQYLRALYLKAMRFFGHSRYQPRNIPRMLRIRITEELEIEKEYADIMDIHPSEKSRLVSTAREFLELSAYEKDARSRVESWLKMGIAGKESDLLVLINAAIGWFRETRIELPEFNTVMSIAESALTATDLQLYNRINQSFTKNEADKLDGMLEKSSGRSRFDYFKDEIKKASSINLQQEFDRLKTLMEYLFPNPVVQIVSRAKIEFFADIGARYTAAELRQLMPAKRRSILYCYLMCYKLQKLSA